MRNYRVMFARSARKELERIESDMMPRILSKIESLSQTPRPRDSRKLRTQTALWRIRIGDYRVIYGIDDTQCVIDIVAIRHRSDAYEGLP